MRALSASAQGCLVGLSLAGALLSGLSAPAEAGTSNLKNPTVTFATAGTKQVTLQVCNPLCSTVASQTVTVWDPRPVVSTASFAPLLPEAGQLVRLTGAGTGKPPLASSWRATPVGGAPLPSLPGSTIWWNTAGVAPGAYTLSFQLQNSAGTATSDLPVVLAPASVLELYTVTPCRLFDSRLSVVPILSGVAQLVQATGGACGIPATARALAANVTVISPSGAGYATIYPGNYPQTVSSTITFSAGDVRSNNAILALATNGAGTLTALLSIAGANGNANLTIDVTGYFVPSIP